MKSIYYQIHSSNLGDTICATPVVRKLSKLYGRRINIINDLQDVFKNSPYVERIIHSSIFDVNSLNDQTEYFCSFLLPGQQNQFGIERKFNSFDIREIHSNDLGFHLMPEEMKCDFFPDKYDNPFGLLKNEYIVLHTPKNWPNRTWPKENWQAIINYLAKRKIYTVLVGREVEEIDTKFHITKNFDSFENLYGQNLINKDNLSLCWHILNDARLFITMDTGLLHMAGTTDVEILQLGSAKDPRLSAPFRKARQSYKYSHLKGPCDLYCTNNLKYSIKEWGTINAVPPLPTCLEGKPSFECQPSIDQVIQFLDKKI